ncbi:hypothetical protein [Woodsholea maritima]|uniref:hypothetical protein n=1 Tax=Woodsholea maritima TaxID=240237 RepID=UPI000376F4EA|nr:hypothetical protein [Woodsholea maritima]
MTAGEKSAVSVIAALVVVGVGYIHNVLGMAEAGEALTMASLRGSVIMAVIASVVIIVAGHIAIGIVDFKEIDFTDERDRLITLKVGRNAGAVQGFTLALAILGFLIEMQPVVLFHVVWAGLVISELVGAGSRFMLYRRGV